MQEEPISSHYRALRRVIRLQCRIASCSWPECKCILVPHTATEAVNSYTSTIWKLGWMLVPTWPTDEMILRGLENYGAHHPPHKDIREVWDAMLNAAPSPRDVDLT